MIKLTGLSLAFAICLATSAFAVGLNDADYEYLATQDVKRSSPVLNGLSPKEQARLHKLINERGAAQDPGARAKVIRDALSEFEANQSWERLNPGQLWDSPNRKPRANN